MAQQNLSVGQSVTVNPGDSLAFVSNAGNTQYHFAVTSPENGVEIDLWAGPVAGVKGKGVARNHPDVPYVDHVTGKGTFSLSFKNVTQPFTVTVTSNSWLKKIFGWG